MVIFPKTGSTSNSHLRVGLLDVLNEILAPVCGIQPSTQLDAVLYEVEVFPSQVYVVFTVMVPVEEFAVGQVPFLTTAL